MDDRHAQPRAKKRQKQRYGGTTTNPGMRIVMRELARKAHEDEPEPARDEVADHEDRDRKRGGSQPHGIGDRASHKDESQAPAPRR